MRSTLVAGLAAAALIGSACHTMVPLTWEDVQAQRPASVYVTMDQSTVEVSGPLLYGDTLVGYVGADFQELRTGDISKVTVRRSAKGKTMALVAASIVGAGAIAVVISGVGSASERDQIDCDYDETNDPRCT